MASTLRLAPSSSSWAGLATAAAGGLLLSAYMLSEAEEKSSSYDVDFVSVRRDLLLLLDTAGSYDDGSYGPLFVRLAWHSAGNYSKHDHTGGTNGATMRYTPESVSLLILLLRASLIALCRTTAAMLV